MRQSILSFAQGRYLWLSLGLMLGSCIAYVLHDPVGVPNGGTWLGYTLGTIGAVLILWLMLFGIRKTDGSLAIRCAASAACSAGRRRMSILACR